MRICSERTRGGLLKDRHASAMPFESSSSKMCKDLQKQMRLGINLADRCAQNKPWRKHYARGGLLVFSVVALVVIMSRADWFPGLYANSKTVQLIPPVMEATKPLALQHSDDGSHIQTRALRAFVSARDESFYEFNPRRLAQKDGGDVGRLMTDAADNGAPNPLGLTDAIKIFVYDLPASFNEDWLVDDRCSNHLFAAEVAVHKRLLDSPARTLRPSEADFFFVPVYVSCNFNTSTGFPSIGHARSMLRSAVKLVSQQLPYWNRSKGKDHIFVVTHDYGACFHTMEDMAVAAGIPRFLQNSVLLQTFGQTNKHACQTNNYVQIPPFVPPSSVNLDWHPGKQRRDIWAYFRGKIELHPKNVSGRIYSRGVRSTIWKRFHHNRRFFVERTRSSDYHSEISRSVFCLCPLGWAPWSPRIVESVIFGCVPVIIADKIALPYSHLIDWPQISITVPEKDVTRLGKILDRVSRTNLSTIQENLWNLEYRKSLIYMDPLTKGDATWQILEVLSKRVVKDRWSIT